MPNHIQNRLQLFGEPVDVALCKIGLASLTDEDVVVDFNRILPMPEELRDTVSGTRDIISDRDYVAYLGSKSTDGTRATLPKDGFSSGHPISQTMAKDFRKRFGATNWYDWATANWQTKWGAYSTRVDENRDNVLYYQTAWSKGNPLLFHKFSQDHPEVTIVHEWADEDTGSNTGRIAWRDGKLYKGDYTDVKGYYENGSIEAYRTAFMLWDRDRQHYRKSLPGSAYMYTYVDSDYDSAWNHKYYTETRGMSEEEAQTKISQEVSAHNQELAETLAGCVSDEEHAQDQLEFEAFCAKMQEEQVLA